MNEILVSAASSLTEVLPELVVAFRKKNPGATVRVNFGASGALMAQIRQGAPVDLFLSASPEEVRALGLKGMAFAGNSLVLIVPKKSTVSGWAELAGPKVRRIALANPGFVPAGRYGKATLVHRKLWPHVKDRLVYAQTARQALAYVIGADVDAGLVFASDARTTRQVLQVDFAVSGRDHPPIRYVGAVLRGSKFPDAAGKFLTFLMAPPAQALFLRFGFTPPEK